jgi:hypothetical protein
MIEACNVMVSEGFCIVYNLQDAHAWRQALASLEGRGASGIWAQPHPPRSSCIGLFRMYYIFRGSPTL